MKILVLNSGSSSQKTALFELSAGDLPDPLPPIWERKLEWKDAEDRQSAASESATAKMIEELWSGSNAALGSPSEISAVGHRVVHGGAKLTEPVVIDSKVKQSIADVSEIAPLHNQAALQGIDLVEELLPGIPQVAVFDTAFHRTLPLHATVYPGPYEWYQRGIRRFGFHGINHEYCAHRAARLLKRELSSLRIVSCHLGNGCSLAAIDGGRSVDTTMGFTPLEGLMMGTRSGSIDPGILTHLMRKGTSGDQLDSLLNHQSGLMGISGVSSDMREVLKAAVEGNARAQLAFDIFTHHLKSSIAAMAASLGGMDVLVFTAGIGENSSQTRDAACAGLKFLGVSLNGAKNSSVDGDTDVSAPDSKVKVLVVRAQEEWAIAQKCFSLTSP
jgi:acetate kinase